MSIAVRGVAAIGTATSLAQITLAVPAAAQTGDLLVALIGSQGNNNPITAPTGWTTILTNGAGTLASTARVTTFFRPVSGTLPSTYAFDVAGFTGTRQAGVIVALSGVHASVPVTDRSGGAGTISDTIYSAGPVATTYNGSALLFLVDSRGGTSQTYTMPGSQTVLAFSAAQDTAVISVGFETIATASSSLSRSATRANSGSWSAQLLAFNPAEADIPFTGWGLPL